MRRIKLLLLFLSLLQLQTVLAADGEWWNEPQYVRHSLTLLIPDWESVWAKYSNNGSLGVEVYKGDKKLESYECAVYDSNGEQRECKSSLVDQGYGGVRGAKRNVVMECESLKSVKALETKELGGVEAWRG